MDILEHRNANGKHFPHKTPRFDDHVVKSKRASNAKLENFFSQMKKQLIIEASKGPIQTKGSVDLIIATLPSDIVVGMMSAPY